MPIMPETVIFQHIGSHEDKQAYVSTAIHHQPHHQDSSTELRTCDILVVPLPRSFPTSQPERRSVDILLKHREWGRHPESNVERTVRQNERKRHIEVARATHKCGWTCFGSFYMTFDFKCMEINIVGHITNGQIFQLAFAMILYSHAELAMFGK